MNWNAFMRQFHRWTSIVFACIVVAIFAALGLKQEPAYWVYMLPLIPLALLTVTGLYMFALPYFRKTVS
jgi:ABC-type polysaccharide/polyol phosphate export permease